MLNPDDLVNISLLKLEAALEENRALAARVAELEAKLAQADPFEPDWSTAPEWAEWHTIDSTGECYWHMADPYIIEPNSDPGVWYSNSDGETRLADRKKFDLTGLDWRNSLRHRPDGV